MNPAVAPLVTSELHLERCCALCQLCLLPCELKEAVQVDYAQVLLDDAGLELFDSLAGFLEFRAEKVVEFPVLAEFAITALELGSKGLDDLVALVDEGCVLGVTLVILEGCGLLAVPLAVTLERVVSANRCEYGRTGDYRTAST